MEGAGGASGIQRDRPGTPGVCTLAPAPLHSLLLWSSLLSVSWAWIYPNLSNSLMLYNPPRAWLVSHSFGYRIAPTSALLNLSWFHLDPRVLPCSLHRLVRQHLPVTSSEALGGPASLPWCCPGLQSSGCDTQHILPMHTGCSKRISLVRVEAERWFTETWSIFNDTGRNVDSPPPAPRNGSFLLYSFSCSSDHVFTQQFMQTQDLLIHSIHICWASTGWVWHCLRCWGNSSAQGGFKFLLFISLCT